MLVPQLLLDTLEGLLSDDFQKFKWYLSLDILDGCRPIPKSHLEMASRTKTVSKVIESYGQESAVSITVEVLKKINCNDVAERLRNMYAEGKTDTSFTSCSSSSASAPVAVPSTISAQQGAVVIASTASNSSCGTWNITIKKA